MAEYIVAGKGLVIKGVCEECKLTKYYPADLTAISYVSDEIVDIHPSTVDLFMSQGKHNKDPWSEKNDKCVCGCEHPMHMSSLMDN